MTERMEPSPPQENADQPIVFVVDDDASMRRALTNLFESVGLKVEAFGSAPQLLQAKPPQVPSCLVLDIRLPGASGLDLQSDLAKANIHTPIIFITGHADIPMTVRAMKGGAIDFLTKPVEAEVLLAAVLRGIRDDAQERERRGRQQLAEQHYACLTPREREVLPHILAGRLNKQIAADLGISLKTTKVHRSRIMQKFGVRSVAGLVRAAEQAHVEPEHA